jgi:hypothetical protein
MMILMPEFWSGVNVGAITMFFAYMFLGRFATFLMLIYLGVLSYRWYMSVQAGNIAFVVQTDMEEPNEMVGELEPLDELTDFKFEDEYTPTDPFTK